MQFFEHINDIPTNARRIDILPDGSGFNVYFDNDDLIKHAELRISEKTNLLRIGAIKSKARHKIETVLPVWRQLNLIIDKLAVFEEHLSSALTIDQMSLLSDINRQLDIIKDIRVSSNIAESQGITAEDFGE